MDDSKDDTPQIIIEVAKDFPAVRMEHRTGESGLATSIIICGVSSLLSSTKRIS